MERIHKPGDADPRSILVILPTWVGDFVMATPTLRVVRTRFAGAHITFLIEPNLHDLVRGGDWMDECVEWPVKSRRSPLRKDYRDLAWDLRRRRFDWAILLPNSFRSALIARLGGAKRRIGYDRDGRGMMLTDRLPVKNRRSRGAQGYRSLEGSMARPGKGQQKSAQIPGPPEPFIPLPLVEYYADLAEAIGCDRPGDKLELFTTPDCDESVAQRLASPGIAEDKPLVVLSPGAKFGAAKCWAPERFAAVADRLIETHGAAVIVTCGPGEESIARQIGTAMQRRGLVFDAPLLTLGELKSLIRRSDLLVCNDSGPRHFAKAFNVPVVTIFGPTHPEWTATSYDFEIIVRIDVPCGPCQKPVCPLGHLACMTGVTVDTVFDACTDLLRTGASVAPGIPADD